MERFLQGTHPWSIRVDGTVDRMLGWYSTGGNGLHRRLRGEVDHGSAGDEQFRVVRTVAVCGPIVFASHALTVRAHQHRGIGILPTRNGCCSALHTGVEVAVVHVGDRAGHAVVPGSSRGEGPYPPGRTCQPMRAPGGLLVCHGRPWRPGGSVVALLLLPQHALHLLVDRLKAGRRAGDGQQEGLPLQTHQLQR